MGILGEQGQLLGCGRRRWQGWMPSRDIEVFDVCRGETLFVASLKGLQGLLMSRRIDGEGFHGWASRPAIQATPL